MGVHCRNKKNTKTLNMGQPSWPGTTIITVVLYSWSLEEAKLLTLVAMHWQKRLIAAVRPTSSTRVATRTSYTATCSSAHQPVTPASNHICLPTVSANPTAHSSCVSASSQALATSCIPPAVPLLHSCPVLMALKNFKLC